MTLRGHPTVFDADPNNGSRIMYAHGKAIYLVVLEDSTKNEVYTEHSYPCTVARFSPNGNYIASGDRAGIVRIWDATQPSHILKGEFQVLGLPVKDICWNAEGTHLIAVGEGREKYAHAFSFDTGSSVGEVIGHTKTVNSVSIKPSRPFKAVTASDDFTVNFYSGVPYKFVKSIKEHNKFVQSVKYSPDGSKFASCGADRKIFVYDGETGDLLKELKDDETAHSWGIMSLAWSLDSKKLLSSSSDQISKCWDIDSGKILFQSQVKFSEKDPQANEIVGSLWTRSGIILLSLSGAYAIVDPEAGAVKTIFQGHSNGLTALAKGLNGNLVSASYDGTVCEWKEGFKAESLTRDKLTKPETRVNDIIPIDAKLYLLTHLDTRGFSIANGDIENHAWLKGSRACAFQDNIAIIDENSVKVFKDRTLVASFSEFTAKPSSVAAHGSTLAVGLEDKSIRIFSLESGKLAPKGAFEANFGLISAMAISKDGKKLAAGDDQRRLKIYDLEKMEPCKSNWCYHNAKISSIEWLTDEVVLTGSLDNSIMLWSLASPIKPLFTIANAHTGTVVGLVSLGEGRFASASEDGSIKLWKAEF